MGWQVKHSLVNVRAARVVLALALFTLFVAGLVLVRRSVAQPAPPTSISGNPSNPTGTNSISTTTAAPLTAPDKWRIEDYYAESRAFGEEHRATEFPSAPIAGAAPAPETGIFDEADAP